eukprot:s151_g9.t1
MNPLVDEALSSLSFPSESMSLRTLYATQTGLALVNSFGSSGSLASAVIWADVGEALPKLAPARASPPKTLNFAGSSIEHSPKSQSSFQRGGVVWKVMTVSMIFPMFELVMFVSAYMPHIFACMIVLATMVRKPFRVCVVVVPVLVFLSLCAFAVLESRWHAEAEGYDLSMPPLREALEDYISTGKGDLHEILEGKKYPPVFGKTELQRYLRTWLGKSVFHDTDQDADYLPEAYNKGDDWFEATLAGPMVYTGAIYAGKDETIWSAQHKKLEFIAHALGVQPGDKALEIGCGWGRLSNHLASKGAKVTGVTMSSDQQAYAKRMSASLGNSDNVEILLTNFFDLQLPELGGIF